MNASDVLAEILIENRKFRNYEEAKQAILQTFKIEYPYWSYGQWDESIPQLFYPQLIETLRNYRTIEIKDLIIDLPAMLAKLRNGNVG
jgi:hypothetical protein